MAAPKTSSPPPDLRMAANLLDAAELVRSQADLAASRGRADAARDLRDKADLYERKANAIMTAARDAQRPREPRL